MSILLDMHNFLHTFVHQIASIVITIILLFVGIILYNKAERDFIDVI